MLELGSIRGLSGAVWLLAVGCVSDEGALFTEVTPLDGEGEPSVAAPAPEGEALGGEPAAAPALPEQLLDSVRDVSPRPLAPASAAAEAAEPPAAPMVADPCALDEVVLCSSFEDDPPGQFPSGEQWLPELAGCGTHAVDGEGPAASGLQALRAGDGGYPECMLHADVSGEEDLYVRTRVFLGSGESLRAEYVSLLELGARDSADDPELRIGLRPALDSLCPGRPGVDVTGSGLAGGPQTECTGVELEQERWYCIESHLSRSGRSLAFELFVDGELLVQRTFAGDQGWSGPELFVKVGRAAYGASGSGALWHDDLAISRQPIGCEVLAPSASE